LPEGRRTENNLAMGSEDINTKYLLGQLPKIHGSNHISSDPSWMAVRQEKDIRYV
jgi:hypothetical protein